MNLNDTTLQDVLDADVWETAERRLLTKMLEEFAYEEIIESWKVDIGDDRHGYRLDLGEVSYRFEAVDRLMDSLHVHGDMIERRADGTRESLRDPLRLLRNPGEMADPDGLTEGNLVREHKWTLLADAHTELRKRDWGGFDPTDLDYARPGGEMEGHLWITYNKGRFGWGYDDYKRYTPERKVPVTPSWAAVRKEHATSIGTEGVNHDSLVSGGLGDHYGRFRSRLDTKGYDPDAYFFMPVYDWQWERTVAPLFPDRIAAGDIALLGDGPDEYFPQQSVRTFVDVDDAEEHHVEVPMRILNMFIWRGLPGKRTELVPTVMEYIKGIYERDDFLQKQGLILPGEIVGFNYDHVDFTDIDGSPYQYHELLGVVWREPIYTFLENDGRAITLSSLVYVGGAGEPFVSRLVEQLGPSLDEWLGEFFDTVLSSLPYFLYRYGIVFSSHGQNTILVVEGGVPTRLAAEDFAEDANVSDQSLPELELLSDDVHDVLRKEPPEGLCQFIFPGLFVYALRYVADVLEEYESYPEREFWTYTRRVVLDYQAQFPEPQSRFDLPDLLRPELTKLSLNRNRIFDYGYDDSSGHPHASEHGMVTSALYEVADE